MAATSAVAAAAAAAATSAETILTILRRFLSRGEVRICNESSRMWTNRVTIRCSRDSDGVHGRPSIIIEPRAVEARGSMFRKVAVAVAEPRVARTTTTTRLTKTTTKTMTMVMMITMRRREKIDVFAQ